MPTFPENIVNAPDEHRIKGLMQKTGWTRKQALRSLRQRDFWQHMLDERRRRPRGKVGPGPGCYGPMF